ncbi:hypothetical protein QUF80_13590 [Desulfococcaceae bacterium HSG8]|nr:hypothetical protein [Desulfococcaceae bacterium HSG8]
MNPWNDFSETLAEEVLSDMAGTFFGARKEVEKMTELFQDFVEKFRAKQAETDVRAAFLNYLLLDEKSARSFYESLRVDAEELLSESRFPDNMPGDIPFAFTAKGEYIGLVLREYDSLQKACHAYLNGESDEDILGRETEPEHVYYNLLVTMCDLINEKIHSVNNDMSPSGVLQYARKLVPGTRDKQRITGGITYGGDECGINQRLSFQPIDFASLQLKKYPELPGISQVNSRITSFCKKHYAEKKGDIKALIFELKEKSVSETRSF